MRVQSRTTPVPIKEKRRGVRMNSRVPVVIEWDNAHGEKLLERAHTRIIGPYGCLLVLPQDLSLEQRLQLTNTATEQVNAGIVVWKGNRSNDGWELGIELVQPPWDFWGIEI